MCVICTALLQEYTLLWVVDCVHFRVGNTQGSQIPAGSLTDGSTGRLLLTALCWGVPGASSNTGFTKIISG